MKMGYPITSLAGPLVDGSVHACLFPPMDCLDHRLSHARMITGGSIYNHVGAAAPRLKMRNRL
jgi:hypothetical protein